MLIDALWVICAIDASMLSGGLPKSGEEAGIIAINLIRSHGRERLGHEIDWGKVTYEGFQDFLVVKFWK